MGEVWHGRSLPFHSPSCRKHLLDVQEQLKTVLCWEEAAVLFVAVGACLAEDGLRPCLCRIRCARIGKGALPGWAVKC